MLTQYAANLAISRLTGRLSKAFDKSISTTAVVLLDSKFVFHSSISLVKACWDEKCAEYLTKFLQLCQQRVLGIERLSNHGHKLFCGPDY